MATAQPGIFALGTRSHYHLELDRAPGATAVDVLDALQGLREPAVTTGGANIVVGFGADLWRELAPAGEIPVDLAPFTAIDGLDGLHAPATQHDLWIWIHGTGEDVALDLARILVAALAPVTNLALEQPCFVYRDSRDLTGFIDGTANPPVDEAPTVGAIAEGEPGAGGCHVLAQRWVHDLRAFHALDVRAQELVFGRTKVDSIELDDAAKPADAHIARAEIEDEHGDERPIFRRSTPYGTVVEHGLHFLAFSAERSRFDAMLARMFGTTGDGRRDHLLDFTRPVTGSYYFAPSLETLHAILGDGSG